VGTDNFVDGRAIGDFTATWRRVEDWLRAHAPEDFAALRGPASARDIAAVTGAFPPHPFLVALLSAHDGSEWSSGAELLPRYGLLPAARMADWRAADSGGPEAEWWVPFAATSTGEYLVVDHRQGPGYGAVLRFDPESGAGGERYWPDLLGLIAELADVLESGGPLRMPGLAAHRPCAGRQLGWEIVPSPEVPAVWLREVWRDAEKRLLRAAPAACAALRPSARPQEIRSAETPDPFHAHLRAFLLLHDGADEPDGFEVFPGGYRPYGCAELSAAQARVKAAGPDTAIGVRVRAGTKTAGGRESVVEGVHGHGEAPSSSADLRPVPPSWLPFAVSREGAELLLCQEQGESYGAVLAWDPVARDYRTVQPDLAALCERVGR